MARQIDEKKLNAIKKAAIETVVFEGVGGASVAKIAKKAGVSVGYLYRFYKGKRELLEALFEERFSLIHRILQQQVTEQSTVKDAITVFVSTMYKVVQKEPHTISFTHRLLSDFSFELPNKFKENVFEICSGILQIGHETGEIDEKITNEKFYAIVVGGVLNFINIRLRNIFDDKTFHDDDIEVSVTLMLKALTPKNE